MPSAQPATGYDYAPVLAVLKRDKWTTTVRVCQLIGRSSQRVLEMLHTAEAEGKVEHANIYVRRGCVYGWRLADD